MYKILLVASCSYNLGLYLLVKAAHEMLVKLTIRRDQNNDRKLRNFKTSENDVTQF